MIWATILPDKSYLKAENIRRKPFEHEAARKLLSQMLKYAYNIDFDEEMISVMDGGKPYLRDYPHIHFNLSHCDGMVSCGLSENNIGIDCEKKRKVSYRVIKRCFSEKEAQYINNSEDIDLAFTKLWTLKESCIKYTGLGLKAGLKKKEFNLDNKTVMSQIGNYRLYIINNTFSLAVCDSGVDSGIYNLNLDISVNNTLRIEDNL